MRRRYFSRPPRASCFVDLALLGDVLGVELFGRADPAVDLELAHDVDLAERLGHVVGALGGRDEPAGRAHREHLDEREALARELRLERPLEHLLRAGDRARVVHRAARDVRRALELRDEVADEDRVAVVLGVAAVDRVLGALTDHGRRGHVAAGLAEHAVVQAGCT